MKKEKPFSNRCSYVFLNYFEQTDYDDVLSMLSSDCIEEGSLGEIDLQSVEGLDLSDLEWETYQSS